MKPMSLSPVPAAFQKRRSVDLAAFLVERCRVLSGLFPGRLNFVQRFENDLHVPEDVAHEIGEIFSIAIENTVRHAHPAGLTAIVALDCRRLSNGHISVDVSDDGVGLPESFDPATADGRGFLFMRERASKLGGDLSIQTGPLGMSVRLTLPSQVQDAA